MLDFSVDRRLEVEAFEGKTSGIPSPEFNPLLMLGIIFDRLALVMDHKASVRGALWIA